MTALAILLLVALVIVIGLNYNRWRRRWILRKPFPAAWLAIIHDRLPFYHRLDALEQQHLRDNVQVFLAQKRFYGCRGQVITDEIRVTIAAVACLLILNRTTGVFPGLKHILVYPDAFVTGHEVVNEDGTISIDDEEMLGESWHDGKVVLSWGDVDDDADNFGDGHNVVLHEFSHQLDSESGFTNGAPLMGAGRLGAWANVLAREYEGLQEAMQRHHQSVMDWYGAESPAEFFAVATETFFEKPREMEERHPELYSVLKHYYMVDPTRWH